MIVVEKLTKQFKGQTVLNGIDLEVKEGEVVAIIGPSGSGKTTFLRCLNFLEQPTSGRVRIGDIAIDSNVPLSQQQGRIRQLRQQVGFVFQNFNLFPHRTALENVVEGPLVVKKTPREQALALGRKLLAKVGLAGKEDAYPRRLSGGQQQRVAIARPGHGAQGDPVRRTHLGPGPGAGGRGAGDHPRPGRGEAHDGHRHP